MYIRPAFLPDRCYSVRQESRTYEQRSLEPTLGRPCPGLRYALLLLLVLVVVLLLGKIARVRLARDPPADRAGECVALG